MHLENRSIMAIADPVRLVLATVFLGGAWLLTHFALTRGVAPPGTWQVYLALALTAVAGLLAFLKSFRGRAAWFALLIVLASAVFQEAALQTILVLAILAGLLITYQQFLGKLVMYMVSHPSQATVMLVYFCLLYGLAGTTSYGVPSLFWYESFWGRFLSAFGSTLFLAVLGVSAYFLDDNYKNNQRAFRRFLIDWHVDYGRLGKMCKALDPRMRRDGSGKNAKQVTRFLRVGRLPLLTLISLPALFPLVFPNVPRLAPTRGLPAWITSQIGSADVGRDGWAWFLGVVCWLSGILFGVLIVKLSILGSSKLEALYSNLPGRLWGMAHKKAGAPPKPGLIKGTILPAASMLVVLAAAVLIALMNAEVIDPFGRTWLTFLNCVLVGLALVLAVWWSGSRANELRPERWPPFFRFLIVVTVLYAALVVWDTCFRSVKPPDWWLLVSPGLAICALLISLSLFGAWVGQLRPVGKDKHRFRSDLLALGLVIIWIGIMNGDNYKLQFKPLAYNRAARKDWRAAVESYRDWGQQPDGTFPPSELSPEAKLLDDRQTLISWRRTLWRKAARSKPGDDPPDAFKPKLAVVCTTGGASRAAYWTARLLQRLGQDMKGQDEEGRPLKEGVTRFHDGVRLITGASGGMVGAAYYLNWRDKDPQGVGNVDWVESMNNNSLPAVASHIALVDVWQALFPRVRHPLEPERRVHPFCLDRGQVLELQWLDLQQRFSDYRRKEGDGTLPSLVFTPVTVDDGRRLIISNLGLEWLAVNAGSEVHAGVRPTSVYSVAALEFYRVFGAGGNPLTLATAARMSGTFPAVSPAVNLPTNPPIRIVDAGYYDNYGVNLAVGWVFKNRDWLEKYTSGVVLVQIRASMGRRDRLGQVQSGGNSISKGLQFFSTPVEAFGTARDTTPMFRNDEETAALGEILAQESRKDFFTTVIFENSAQVLLEPKNGIEDWPFSSSEVKSHNAPHSTDVAMTWYLSRAEVRSMDSAIPSDRAAKSWKLVDGTLKSMSGPDKDSLYYRAADRVRWIAHIRSKIRELEKLDRPNSNEETHESMKDEGRRSYYVKELERALNYERIRALKSWWER
jgi:hypothetical protein